MIKQCRACSASFEPTASQVRHSSWICPPCSRQKAKDWHRRVGYLRTKSKTRPPSIAGCKNCGKPTQRRRLYCSQKCTVIHNSKIFGECWIWTGRLHENGYGTCGKHGRAHRISYEAFVGPIEAGKLIRHSCNVRKCVNPAHLLPGSDWDNVHDAIEAGTFAIQKHGEENTQAKLKKADVIKIRSDTRRHKVICKDYGVSASTISNIKTRKTWNHIE